MIADIKKWTQDTSSDVSFHIQVATINKSMAPQARRVIALAVIEAATKLRAQGIVLGCVSVQLVRETSALTFAMIDLPVDLPGEVTTT